MTPAVAPGADKPKPRYSTPMMITGRALVAGGTTAVAVGGAFYVIASLRARPLGCNSDGSHSSHPPPMVGGWHHTPSCPSGAPFLVGSVLVSVGFLTAFTGLPLWLTGRQPVDSGATVGIPEVVATDRDVALRWRF